MFTIELCLYYIIIKLIVLMYLKTLLKIAICSATYACIRYIFVVMHLKSKLILYFIVFNYGMLITNVLINRVVEKSHLVQWPVNYIFTIHK
jgi:hypothetical protein